MRKVQFQYVNGCLALVPINIIVLAMAYNVRLG